MRRKLHTRLGKGVLNEGINRASRRQHDEAVPWLHDNHCYDYHSTPPFFSLNSSHCKQCPHLLFCGNS